MKIFSLFALFIVLIVAISCSKEQTEVETRDESYFLGSWSIKKPVQVSTGAELPLRVIFKENGLFELNMHVQGSPPPVYQWNYDAENAEFFMSTSGEEKFEVIEITDKYFKIRNQSTGDELIFTKE